ncbi:hypothetical protein BBJ28_00013400 [Nothophytophthora sp. Chile5]|nr:hypothetical protein BBJ28_00013400 [Nothophytophthora sp. Chile5]
MSHDDILDDMSLSDDEMLDNLADDMLMEMAEEEVQQEAVAAPSASPSSWSRAAVPTNNSNNRMVPPAGAANMPDLGQMMSQMMPMMSQMFGNSSGGNPMFGGGNNSLQQAPVSWQELVKRHVPSAEQQDWLTTIENDAKKLRVASAAKLLEKPHSRSYRTKPSPLPNVYMEVGTLLGSMLNEAVRVAHLEHNRQWQGLHGNLVSQLARSGMTKVFEQEFKDLLRQRVANDPDYQADKASNRYRNISAALSV